MTILASDNFTRANGALGANWSNMGGGAINALTIVSDAVQDSSLSNDGAALYTGISWPNDQYSQGTIVATSSGCGPGLVVRGSVAAQTAYVLQSSSTTWTIQSFVAGTVTNLTSGTGTFVASDTLLLQAVGTTISAYHNGVLLGSVTNSAIASGNAGIYISTDGSNLADAVADNFVGGNFAVPTSYFLGNDEYF